MIVLHERVCVAQTVTRLCLKGNITDLFRHFQSIPIERGPLISGNGWLHWCAQNFQMVAYFQSNSTCLCGKLGLRGGYFCLEVVSTNHHHRPVWAHPCNWTAFISRLCQLLHVLASISITHTLTGSIELQRCTCPGTPERCQGYYTLSDKPSYHRESQQ